MVAPSTLVGQPPTLPVASSANNPQLDRSSNRSSAPNASSSNTSPSNTNTSNTSIPNPTSSSTIVNTLSSLVQLVSLLTAATTDTPLINSNQTNAAPIPGNATPVPGTTTPVQGNAAPVPGTSAGQFSAAEISKATGGNAAISAALAKVAQDPAGARALRIALDQGTTFKQGQLAGATAGVTSFAGNRPPTITLESLNVDVVAHEVAHAAFPNADHDDVYAFGRQVARNLGITPIT